jgi:hypothetical protein
MTALSYAASLARLFDQSYLTVIILISRECSPSDVVFSRKDPPGPVGRRRLVVNNPRFSQMIIINVLRKCIKRIK